MYADRAEDLTYAELMEELYEDFWGRL